MAYEGLHSANQDTLEGDGPMMRLPLGNDGRRDRDGELDVELIYSETIEAYVFEGRLY